MATDSTTPPPDRDLTDPVDTALAGALSRAGDELCEVSADVAHGHLDAIAELAATHAHTAPAPGAGSTWTAWRLRVRRLAGMTAVKVALGAGVAAAGTTGGLAATGNLPAPAQQVVSDTAAWFGIRLPAPAADPAAGAVDGDEPDQQPGADSDRPPRDSVRPVPPPSPEGADEDARDRGPVEPDAPVDEDEPGPPGTDPEPHERPAPEQGPESGGDRPAPAEQPYPGDAPAAPGAGPDQQDGGAGPVGDEPAGGGAARDDDTANSPSSQGGPSDPASTSGDGGDGPDGSRGTDVGGPVQDELSIVDDEPPQG